MTQEPKRIPAPLDEKNVTTDWIEECLPENPYNIAIDGFSRYGDRWAAFFRYNCLWEARYRMGDNQVVIFLRSRRGAKVLERMCSYLKDEVFTNLDDLKVSISSRNGNAVVISFWWETEE